MGLAQWYPRVQYSALKRGIFYNMYNDTERHYAKWNKLNSQRKMLHISYVQYFFKVKHIRIKNQTMATKTEMGGGKWWEVGQRIQSSKYVGCINLKILYTTWGQ
jgi:hypothetical protein